MDTLIKPVNASDIKNKIKRGQILAKQMELKSKIKQKIRFKRRQLEQENPELKEERQKTNIPKTLENMREEDDTVPEAEDPELAADEESDELAEYFVKGKEPKVLVTTNKHAKKVGYAFAEELASIFPTGEYIKRKPQYDIKHIVEFSSNRGYTDVLIVNEDHKKLNLLTHIHLPNGPTAVYKLTSVKSKSNIRNHARASDYKPELILNNFTTRMGRQIGRMFMCLFPHVPEFQGRQAVTFHNQRDFVFFRRHRYIFRPGKEGSEEAKAELQEIGPRFTLKIQSLQKGVYDLEKGDYEWIRKAKQDGRKKFVL
ncbi:hypothetical protein MP638_007319 [Amoeboaphelidium occidentale]|nr:hypothetical protein MP638_007319 [Amoeboaphelidium occidentale]